MKQLAISIFILSIFFISCKTDNQRPISTTENFPATANKKGKKLYIVLKKAVNETRSNVQIIKFLKRRLLGAGMKSKIKVNKEKFYIVIFGKNIPVTIKKIIENNGSNLKTYFKNLLEQKIKITLHVVDSGFMQTLPPMMVKNGGDYFGKIIPVYYKSQIRPAGDAYLYPIIKSGPKAYMVVKSFVLLDGNDILSARLEYNSGRPNILIKFTRNGARKFSYFTRRYLQERIAVLVNGWVLAAPVVREHIPDGEAIIEGKITQKRATQMAAFFNASGGYSIYLDKIEYR